MLNTIVNQRLISTKGRHIVDILIIVILHTVNDFLWYCATYHREKQFDMALKPGLRVTCFPRTAFCNQIGMVPIYLLDEEPVLIMGGIDKRWVAVACRTTHVLQLPFIFLRGPCLKLGPNSLVLYCIVDGFEGGKNDTNLERRLQGCKIDLKCTPKVKQPWRKLWSSSNNVCMYNEVVSDESFWTSDQQKRQEQSFTELA